MVEQNAGIVD